MNEELEALIVQAQKNAEENNALLEALITQNDKNNPQDDLEAIAKASLDVKDEITNSKEEIVKAINDKELKMFEPSEVKDDIVKSVKDLSLLIENHYKEKKADKNSGLKNKEEKHKRQEEFKKELLSSIGEISNSFPEIPKNIDYSDTLNEIISELKKEKVDLSKIENYLSTLINNVLKIGLDDKLIDGDRIKVSLSEEQIKQLGRELSVTVGGGGYEKVYIKNVAGADTNVSTKELQEEISSKIESLATQENQATQIANQEDILGLMSSSDLEGKGDITVGLTQVAVTITGTPKTIRIRAGLLNTGIIYIGKTGVLSNGSNDFVRLESGDEIIITYNDTTNALYAISDTAGQTINVGVLL